MGGQVGLGLVLAAWACGGGAVAPVGVGHATTWAPLVAAADRGDLATVQVHARDLALGALPADAAEDPAATALGGALGFLQLVDDPADLPDAVSKARAACVDCHARRGVLATVP